ncbi:phage head closure protein [Paracoccus salipaludis]|uniref:Head-tail adaptor protein n=1 Tax=Paracoccus salipaludis TaxID=2032623 RepID=A0A2A2GPS9_9RHOB|nr:phage head closure protein [Paracoccus salipaludis]PAU98965.1 head-tail adaptor protein [Paracoccus salipaludis]
MRAGKLTHTIAIEREVETVKPSGHVSRTWATIATMRAEQKQGSATEFLAGFGEGTESNVIFLIRWPGIEITVADRITHAGKSYNIKSLVEIGRRRGLELRVSAA